MKVEKGEDRVWEKIKQEECTLPASVGDCANYQERWYYDTSNKRCQQFYWGGCGGNANNFASENNCTRRCAEAVETTTTTTTTFQPTQDDCFLAAEAGPCSGAETRWAYEPRAGACRPFAYGGCGGNGNNFPSLENCQDRCLRVLDRCQLPMLAGPCGDSLMRWFYDATTDSCSQFSYSGCDGNDNRFETREDCERRCRAGAPVHPTAVVTTTTSPGPLRTKGVVGDSHGPAVVRWGSAIALPSKGRQPTLRPAISEMTTGGIERRDELQHGAVPNECRVPGALEQCAERGMVWYYDERSQQCAPHENNGDGLQCRYTNAHRSEEECQRRCGAFRNLDVCRYDLDAGPCTQQVPKFYWDAALRSCAPFTYGGCHGGPNRFSSLLECREVCEPPDSFGLYANGLCPCPPKDPCALSTDPGSCSGYFIKWYFDATRQSCNRFVYGGCGGNDNRFDTLEECEGRCKKLPSTTTGAPAPPPPPPPFIKVSLGFKLLLALEHRARRLFVTGLQNSSAELKEQCRPPASLAPCGRDITAYYYDVQRGCAQAPIGDCPYLNRYYSEEECERSCGRFQDRLVYRLTTYTKHIVCTLYVCAYGLDAGTCEGSVPKVYWDAATGRCEQFTYSGCGGGPNRFSTLDECQRVCGKTSSGECRLVRPTFMLPHHLSMITESPGNSPICNFNIPAHRTRTAAASTRGGRGAPPALKINVVKPPTSHRPSASDARCRLRAHPGACPGPSSTRWYYNEAYGDCLRFVYTGCGGNDNNFLSYRDCLAACQPTDLGGPHTHARLRDAIVPRTRDHTDVTACRSSCKDVTE
ncbi:Papilin [Eumeta japonica]|uniref:Papilin n=1 Tax=Eumeta variegata TaxID=151549 RepID=A0A4C1X3M0_EUMVA|nr:Papilin [Eumeta japonica]